ncbi:MAG: radical SAM protein [Phycisphaerae bacterium]|nr:radical SAM protein [Saprospiraceae bacterium]
MQPTVYLITPPFTQLNTPYPATAYLKGFLNTKQIAARQADLGIEVILALFSKQGLTNLFAQIATLDSNSFSDNARRIIALQDHYIQSIEAVILFLQGKNPTLSHLICQEGFLPEASRFAQLNDLDWAFGALGTQDKAKHLATLYLEDLSDLIKECVDPHFGFSRYAERLGRSANTFDELYDALQQDYTYIDQLLIDILEQRMAEIQPDLVAISVPFPGNLYAAFRCAQWIKKHCPNVKIAMGGGFANTELRSLSEPRVFEFFDFITLDDGEAPVEHLVEHLAGKRPLELLKRAFALVNDKVEYFNFSLSPDYKQMDTGTPDYSDLWLDRYISVLEIANPMHRMWSDGRWNKLTMAHGCYWGKCTFCDISLDYIKVYEPLTASLLCDRMEEMIAQTGENGFHFVDEAAPPALMRALALEIIRRKLIVSWWTNIRFEKSFTRDLCVLLRASGCVAISGGLEVASDRLLGLIQKGVTVAQVAQVTRNFTEAGIMVHAYLMYGFPTQTAQETIDSLEMVRQMFEVGILQSGFWHQFAMTAHSPVGMYPEQFGVQKETEQLGSFANNDLVHLDPSGTDHEAFSYGLKKSLLNFMHGIGLDFPLYEWFDHKVPRTSIPKNYVAEALEEAAVFSLKPTAKLVWLGTSPTLTSFTKSKKGKQWEMVTLTFQDKKETFTINLDRAQGEWMALMLQKLSVANAEVLTFQEVKAHYEASGLEDFEMLWYGKPLRMLGKYGLLAL